MEKSPYASDPIAYLVRLLREPDGQVQQMIADRDRVHREYGRLFHPDNLERLQADDFKAFLLYENNRHWWGIHRHQGRLVSDMDRLRGGLAVLVDETRPIEERLDRLEPRAGPKPVPGLGRAVFTPILHVVYPDRYGVWNSIAENAMARLGLWPSFVAGWGFGLRYRKVNQTLRRVAADVGVDLWTLDSLWWNVEREHDPTHHQFDGTEASSASVSPSYRRASHAGAGFVCGRCFQRKAPNLLAVGHQDVCTDCIGDR